MTPLPSRLFDFQVNGFAQVDFQDPTITAADLITAARALRAHGLAGMFLTLVTNTGERLCAQFQRLESFRRSEPLLDDLIWGYHLEGPWLRPEVGYCGAHPREKMCAPSLALFDRLQAAAGGNIRLVTLAPEWPGSDLFIGELVRQGVHIALGHTNANDAEIDRAIAAGARFATHLGNGVPRILPRHDNVIQRLLARDELYACLIPDGIHLPPFVLKNLYRAKPAGRVLFTTDAISAAGAPPGTYSCNGMRVTVGPDLIVRDPGPSGGFAGSALTPDRGVALTAHFLDLSPAAARTLWSAAPISAFGLFERAGSVVPSSTGP